MWRDMIKLGDQAILDAKGTGAVLDDLAALLPLVEGRDKYSYTARLLRAGEEQGLITYNEHHHYRWVLARWVL